MDELVAPPVRGLRPYVPGKSIAELERTYGFSECARLDSNENPLGAGVRARRAVLEASEGIGAYPDAGALELKARLSRHHGVPVECITLGNGSNEILSLLTGTFLAAGVEAVYSQFCFAIFPLLVQASGAQGRFARAYSSRESMPFGHRPGGLLEQVTSRTRLVYIANPNNPTGTWVGEAPLLDFLEALPRTTLAVVDEAYFEYSREWGCPDASLWLPRLPNLVVVRTFSKAYGLAGLRTGYCLSHPEVAERLNRVRQPFNVSSIAQAAALAALDDVEHLERTVRLNRDGQRQLREGLERLALTVVPTAGNFVLVDTRRPAEEIHEKLLHHGVIVRPAQDYGLTQHLRVTIGTAEQNQRFLIALSRVLS